MREKVLIAVVSACSLLGARSAMATLLASDSFPTGSGSDGATYAPGVALFPSQGPTTLGFSGAWASGAGTSNVVAESTELDNAALGGTPSGDVLWESAAASASARSIARATTSAVQNASATGSTYYTATLVEEDSADATPVAGAFVGLGYANSVVPASGATSGYGTGLYVGFAEETASDPGSLVIRTRTTSAAADYDTVLESGLNGSLAGQAFLVVTETNVNYSGSLDRITYWVNPTNLASDATMTATAAATDAASPLSTYANGGTTADLARLEFAIPIGFTTNVEFDETRLATTSADLYVTPTPEPASLGLIGLAVGGLVRRRRRA